MKLSDYLEQTKTTASEFGCQIGVNVITVRRYLNGDRRPHWQILQKIAEVTRGAVTADDFMTKPEKRRDKAA